MRWQIILALVAIRFLFSQHGFGAETTKLPIAGGDALTWHDDYLKAVETARDSKTLLLVWFADEKKAAENEKFAANVLEAAEVRPLLAEMTLAKISSTASIEEKGKTIKLLEHATLKELLGGRGLAMIDFRDEKQKFQYHVVSIYPFQRGEISLPKFKVLCELPAGTLTQRTLMFAVRTHSAKPASAWSPHSEYLAKEAEKHSVQTLLDAAEECVDSWSQSSGHWAAVSAKHAYFGYDMKRGTNGVWYATGIFGGR